MSLLTHTCAALFATLVLTSCGGGGTDASSTAPADEPVLPAADRPLAEPTFHIAPVLLDEPSDIDMANARASASRAPHEQALSAELAGLDTRRLTLQAINTATAEARRARALGASTPQATPASVSVYTPAQIRAAYGLPELPAAGTTPSAGQAALLGAGQTIYIVDAFHDPNVVAELTAFNQRFGLPACETRAIPVGAALPLDAASTSEGCVFSVVYSTAAAGMRSSAPAYDSSWATEITLDVQWAHATAPLARIILIEAPDASGDALVGAIRLANAMGPGAVSMSFGSRESAWTNYADSAFSGNGMAYLAATGDWGSGVMWPSVSSRVLAVGGTRLTFNGSGARSEVGWSSTGGGISAYVGTPAYQAQGLPGGFAVTKRTVADVGFNADPGSGQYTAVISPGSTTPSWLCAGGTSLSTPQWAGLIAIANALRAQAGKGVLGEPHNALYGHVGGDSSSYARAFADITSGANGSCATCSARAGYDTLTGLGTPNVASLLAALTEAGTGLPLVEPPTVASAYVAATVGKALSFTVTASAKNPLTYTLAGAPAGMKIATAGVVSWPKPVLGSFAVTVSARDGTTGLTGKGVYTVKVEPVPVKPVLSAATLTGQVGTALSHAMVVKATHALSYSLDKAPGGMRISDSGTVSWAEPVAGSHAVTVIGKDVVTGLTGQALLTLRINPAPVPPELSDATATGVAGKPLSVRLTVKASHAVSYSMGDAPAGLRISGAGNVSWARPAAGEYTVTVTVKDRQNGLSDSATLRLAVEPAPVAPQLTASTVTGTAEEALELGVDLKADHAVSWSLAGAPAGMTIGAEGVLRWPAPVAGSYNVTVTAKDKVNGLSGKALYRFTIARKPVPPVITATSISGKVGKALSATIPVKDPAGYALSVSVVDLPAGLLASVSGAKVTLKWASPVAGSYNLAVRAVNTAGLATEATVRLTITAR